MATVRANGVELRVNRYRVGADGDRPVVVFVHGLGIVDHSGLAFTLGMPLATDAEAILYALRGHGHSEVVASGYRVADHVADLIALLDALGVRAPVHLVGCSYGGAVAVTAAARHPGRVGVAVPARPRAAGGGLVRAGPGDAGAGRRPAGRRLHGRGRAAGAGGRVPAQGDGRGPAGRTAAGPHHDPRRCAERGSARPAGVRSRPLPGHRRLRRPVRDAAPGRRPGSAGAPGPGPPRSPGPTICRCSATSASLAT